MYTSLVSIRSTRTAHSTLYGHIMIHEIVRYDSLCTTHVIMAVNCTESQESWMQFPVVQLGLVTQSARNRDVRTSTVQGLRSASAGPAPAYCRGQR